MNPAPPLPLGRRTSRPAALLLAFTIVSSPLPAQDSRPSSALPSYRENFDGKFVPVPDSSGDSPVKGQIPAGWTERSSRNGTVSVTYSQVPDAPSKAGLRVDAARITAGATALRLEGLKLAADTFYRLKITARTGNFSDMTLALTSADSKTRYWAQNVSSIAEWKEFEFIIPPLKAADDNATFSISASRSGQMDFEDFSLTPIAEKDIAGSFKGEGNLLLHSSFPTGLAAPSFGGASGLERVDPNTLGPSGLPALKVDPSILMHDHTGKKYYTNTVSSPFVGKPTAEHTFSVFLKGSRDGQQVRLQLTPPDPDSPANYRTIVTLTPEWKRYEFTVKLPYTPKGFYLAQVGSVGYDDVVAPFWIDQMQVEVGSKATPFRRGAALEVALSTPKNFALFFENEPLQVEATVWGEVKPGTLLGGAFSDGDGRVYPVAPQPLAADVPTQKVVFSLPRGKEPAFGVYRFAAEARQAGKPVSRLNEIAMGRVRRPRLADQFVPDSPFGVHAANVSQNNLGAQVRHLQVAHDLGFKWLRQEFSWSQIERADGSWDFTTFDRLVEDARKRYFCILGIFSGGPAKYLVSPEANKGWNYWAGMVRPEHMPKQRDAVKRIAGRYKGIIYDWETQNESDLPGFSFGAIVDGKKVAKTSEQMLELQKATYEAANEVDPKIRVWWDLAWARVPESEAFVEGATKAGIWQYVEGFSFHLYNGNFHGFLGDAVQKRIEKVRSVMPADKRDLPVWNTEGGVWSNEFRDETPNTPPYVPESRNRYFADWVVRYYVSNFANGVPKFFFFNINGPTLYAHDAMNTDGSPSRLAVSFSNLAWHLEGKTFQKMTTLPEGVNAYLFSDGKDSVAVLLSSDAGRLRLAEPLAGITARDTYGNALPFPARIGDAPTFWSGAGLSAEQLDQKIQSAWAEKPAS